MASIPITGAPAAPAGEPWPDDDPVSIRADELFARRLDNDFSAGVRGLLHDPETGLSSLSGEAALEAVAGIYPALEKLKQRTLADAVGPRQKALLQPLIDTRLDWAAGTIGRLAERATVELDDASVAERLAGLRQDAEASWHDPAHLRTLGRAAVGELRWQGERRGWDDAETEARTGGGLSDLYAGAVEAAMGRDLDSAASLLAHAREVIAPGRLETIDRQIARVREDGLLREVDAALNALPLDPASPPLLDGFITRMSELAPENAAPEVRARLDELSAYAHRRAERQWQKLQSDAGVAALDWFRQNPDSSSLFLPEEVRAWLASDQLDGLRTLEEQGRLVTDPDMFERLDRQLVYEPDAFAALDLGRHRLSLDDADHARYAAAQKAITDGVTDPAFARYSLARLDIDCALETSGIDGEGVDAPDAGAAEEPLPTDIEAVGIVDDRPEASVDADASAPANDRPESGEPAAFPPSDEAIQVEIVDWLMTSEPGGVRQTERPPASLWARLSETQRQAVDVLIARHAEDAWNIQRVSDPKGAANDNTRNYVCTQAVYSCLSNAPDDAPPRWRESCLKAETLCNQFVNRSRANPFGRSVILNFPDHSRVVIPQGKGGGVFVPPR